jgi:polyphosphate glucokinase
MANKKVLGIDVGGSGIKGAPVDIEKGELTMERFRIDTPQPATPKAVSKTINEIVKHFKWNGPIGVGFPAAVQNGVVKTASNIDKSWIGVNAQTEISKVTGCPTLVLNDADAAGVAEMKYGAGRKNKGSIILITVGTGLGFVMFSKKKLVPNLELGHLLMPNGVTGEEYAADRIRKEEELDWTEWGARFSEYLSYVEKLMYPDLFIIGGGVSKKLDKFNEVIKCTTPVVPAKLLNEAGLIGAARAASKEF